MFSITVNKGETYISAAGEKEIILAETLVCVEACRNFLAKHMEISKERAITLIVESLTE